MVSSGLGNISAFDAASSSNSSSASKTSSSTSMNVDGNEFLVLLTTQLRYQNPLNPQDGSTMMAELAQFSALEKLNSIDIRDRDMQLVNAAGMIGKTAEYLNSKGKIVEGKITGVELNTKGELSLIIDKSSIPLSSVTEIKETKTSTTSSSSSSSS